MKRFVALILSLFALHALNARQPLCFSDNGVVPALCQQIAEDPQKFKNFKQDPLLRMFVENASEEEGWVVLPKIVPEFLAKCRCNDQVGHPQLVSYGRRGKFSPTTLRYAKIASDLKREFGSLDQFRLMEIGGGYGGICTLLSKLFVPKSYTILDLPESGALCQRYLREQKVEASFAWLPEMHEQDVDLVVSYLFFSEMDRTLQKQVIDKILSRAKAGFLICAPGHWKEIPYSATEHRRVKPFSREELLRALQKRGINARAIPEDPLTGKGHFVIVWNNVPR